MDRNGCRAGLCAVIRARYLKIQFRSLLRDRAPCGQVLRMIVTQGESVGAVRVGQTDFRTAPAGRNARLRRGERNGVIVRLLGVGNRRRDGIVAVQRILVIDRDVSAAERGEAVGHVRESQLTVRSGGYSPAFGHRAPFVRQSHSSGPVVENHVQILRSATGSKCEIVLLETDAVLGRLLGKCYDIGKRPGGVGRVAEIEGDLSGNGRAGLIFLEFDGQPVVSDDPSGTDLPQIAAATQILECEHRIDGISQIEIFGSSVTGDFDAFGRYRNP
jgi:hypothetical protein